MNNDRAQSYAAKWIAEHDTAEPPVHEVPTDEALARCFANCGISPKPAMYPSIRAAIKVAQAIIALNRAINLDPEIVKQYKKNRAENPGLPASYALRWAKNADANVKPDGFNVHGDPFEVDGFDIEISYEYDDANDYSHLGQFTDSWSEDAVENPEWHNDRRGTLRYFVPEMSERENFEYLNKHGMAKSAARELARSYTLRDMEQARNFVSHVVTVTASKEGIELGSAVLGGVDDEDYIPECVMDHEMIKEAIASAKAALAKLQEV